MTFIPTIKIVNGQTYYKMVNPDLKYEYYISENYSIIYDKQLKASIKSYEIKPYFNTGTGYYAFHLIKSGSSSAFIYYHRALYEAVNGPIGELVCDHRDGDKLNNALSNLQAISQAENARKGANSKIDATTALAIYQAYKTASDKTMSEVAIQFEVPRTTVKNIISGQSWYDITGHPKYQQKRSIKSTQTTIAKRQAKYKDFKQVNNL